MFIRGECYCVTGNRLFWNELYKLKNEPRSVAGYKLIHEKAPILLPVTSAKANLSMKNSEERWWGDSSLTKHVPHKHKDRNCIPRASIKCHDILQDRGHQSKLTSTPASVSYSFDWETLPQSVRCESNWGWLQKSVLSYCVCAHPHACANTSTNMHMHTWKWKKNKMNISKDIIYHDCK